MNKRKKKKYIPKNTFYCERCTFYVSRGSVILTRESGCEHAEYCTNDCLIEGKASCTYNEYRCSYLGIVDRDGETALSDGVKVCNVSLGFKNKG